MATQKLALRVDAAQPQAEMDQIAGQLFEQFPEFGLELIHNLLLRAFHEVAVFSCRPAAGAGNDVVHLEIVLNTARIFEICAAALVAGQRDRVAHGQTPFGDG